MTFLLIAAQAAPPITIELPTAVSAAAWVITALLAGIGILSGVVAYFLRRELKSNDAAHRELTGDIKTVESDVKKLLAGQGRIEGALNALLNQRQDGDRRTAERQP